MGWGRKMDTTGCSSFLFIPLLLLLQVCLSPSASATEAEAGTVFLKATASASNAAALMPEDLCPKVEEEWGRWWCNGSDRECGLEDTEGKEALGLDSFTNQQLLAAASYIRYPTLRRDNPGCDMTRGNCRPRAVAPNPPTTRCTGWCRRDYNPTDAAAY